MADEQTYVKGQVVLFKAYTELQEGIEPILQPDEKVRIDSINDDGSMVVYTIDRKDGAGNLLGDQVFPEEIAPTGDAADIPTAEVAKPKRTRAKADAKPAEAAAPVAAAAPAEAAAKPAKGKNATKVERKAVTTPAPVEAAVPTITDAESVREILAESGDAVSAAKALVEQGEKTDYTLGGVLHHIYSEGVFKAVVNPKTKQPYEGKRGFADFVEAELGVAYRKAMYLVSIYTTFRQLNIDEDKLTEMGWSKAKELVRIARASDDGLKLLEKDFDKLAEFAKNNTRDDLISKIDKDYVKAGTGGSATENVQKTTFKFVLFGEAGNVAQSAIDAAKAKLDTDVKDPDAAAFEMICGEWSLTEAEMTVEQAIALVQNKFGVTLELVEDEDGDEAEAQALAGAETGGEVQATA